MEKRTRAANITDSRMVSIPEAAVYMGLGRSTAKKWLLEIGAIRTFGTRKLVDLRVVDAALDHLD